MVRVYILHNRSCWQYPEIDSTFAGTWLGLGYSWNPTFKSNKSHASNTHCHRLHSSSSYSTVWMWSVLCRSVPWWPAVQKADHNKSFWNRFWFTFSFAFMAAVKLEVVKTAKIMFVLTLFLVLQLFFPFCHCNCSCHCGWKAILLFILDDRRQITITALNQFQFQIATLYWEWEQAHKAQ